MTGSSRARLAGRDCVAVLALSTLAGGCTQDPSRDAPIDAFPDGSPPAAADPSPTPSAEVGTPSEVPGYDPPRARPVTGRVSARDREVAGFLLREQLLRVRLDGYTDVPGEFAVAPPSTELPDGLVLERWLGGVDGYLACLYDNDTGRWALDSGYVFEGTTVSDVEVGDGFDRRCL